MADDHARLHDFARRYAKAWGSHDPAEVASYYAPAGTIAINGGPRTPIVDAANGFISAFPDIQVHMDELIFRDETVEFHWTFTGTNTGPGGSGKSVRISGREEWTFGEDGLVSASDGHYDQAEYDRQLEQGASA